jgi:sugar phosphate isomerase/epimerase
MRLGAPVFVEELTPARWVAALRQKGYRAAYCPVKENADGETIRAYEQAAQEADIVIAEVGAWSNPISPDDDERHRAITLCQQRLALADEIGARCCVNIAGARGERWDGPHPDNLSQDTFDLIVETTRTIIDAVGPTRTYFTLEAMPWIYPDSPDSYVRLIKAIDRERFAVHLDPVNIVSSPQRYFDTAGLLRECFEKLGRYIKSCHAKDIILSDRLTVHLDETRPGLGGLDYVTFLRELDKLAVDTPLMLEHLSSEKEYDLAAEHVRTVASRIGVDL